MLKLWLPRVAMAALLTTILVGGRLLTGRLSLERDGWLLAALCAAAFTVMLVVEIMWDRPGNDRSTES